MGERKKHPRPGWSKAAKALRFGASLDAIAFRDGKWWWIDMTGTRRGPITRREAYLTAVSYMDAREVADHDAQEAAAEIRAGEVG